MFQMGEFYGAYLISINLFKVQIHTILQILFQLLSPLIGHRYGHGQIVLRGEGWQPVPKDSLELEDPENTQ